VCGREREVDVAGFADRLPSVQRLEHGELARSLLQDPRDPEEVLRPFRGPKVGPAVRERVAGSADREVDVLGACLRDLRERLLARRIERGVALAGARLHELTADVQAVAVGDRDDVARFGRRRIRPVAGRGRRAALALDLAHRRPPARRAATGGRGLSVGRGAGSPHPPPPTLGGA
jgi:hypothetical protein